MRGLSLQGIMTYFHTMDETLSLRIPYAIPTHLTPRAIVDLQTFSVIFRGIK